MGMIPEGVRSGGQETVESGKAHESSPRPHVIMTAISKFCRLTTQIAILVGACCVEAHVNAHDHAAQSSPAARGANRGHD